MQDTYADQMLRTIAAEIDDLSSASKGLSARKLLAPVRSEIVKAAGRTTWWDVSVAINQWLGEIFPAGPGNKPCASITSRAVRVATKPKEKNAAPGQQRVAKANNPPASASTSSSGEDSSDPEKNPPPPATNP